MPRLRHDKVAQRVVAAVRSALDGDVPEGLCAVYAIAAPIREPRQTIRGLVEMIRTRLRSGLEGGEHADFICGNQIRLRIVAAGSPEAARVLGFVHNPDPPPDALLDTVEAQISREAASSA
jgi:hypothetical protein